MSETEVVTEHDLIPTADELYSFSATGSYMDPPMRVEIQFAPKLKKKLGDITPIFNLPEGFRLRDYFQYLNPDCEIRTSWATDDIGAISGCTLEITKSGVAVYRVVAIYEGRANYGY